MEHSSKQRKLLLYLYTACLAVLSVSVFLMPFGMQQADQSMAMTYVAGGLFWTGLLGTVVVAACITHFRRQSREFAKLYAKHKRLGLIHFFQNKEALVCDVLMFGSFIGFIIARIWAETTVWPFVFLSVLIFTFGMHCMLNGSNYIYINYRTRRVIEL